MPRTLAKWSPRSLTFTVYENDGINALNRNLWKYPSFEDKLPIPESKSFAEYVVVAEKPSMEQTA